MKHLPIVLCALLALTVIGCPKRQTVTTVPAPPSIEIEAPSSDDLPDVLFDFDMAAIRQDQMPTMQANADVLKKILDVSDIDIMLAGHACPLGTSEYNLALSHRRAEAVRNWLTWAGVPAANITALGFGEEQLLTEDPELYWQNRRVEFHVQQTNRGKR